MAKKSITDYFSKKVNETSTEDLHSSSSSLPTASGVVERDVGVLEEYHNHEGRDFINKEAEVAERAKRSIITPNQPRKFKFPKTAFGKQNRAFQHVWFNEYPWLHYDETNDAAFCYICINQEKKGNLKSARTMDPAFISQGFSNWKRALERFNQHQISEWHKLAIEYEIVIPKTHGDVIDLTSETAKKTREENRRCLAKIIESLQYLARQGVAIRGDDDERSNFIQLLKLRAKDDKDLAKWLESKSGSYTSHAIQNELISIMANHTIRDLVNEIRDNWFSIICDEYIDVGNKEQLTFCLRWNDENLEAHEDFIGFYQIPNIAANTITSAIKDALIRLPLSLHDCRGQCYDGASNMLGKKSGVAQQILALQPKAFATHCHGHSLSLSGKDVVKDCKLLSDTMDTAKELVTLIKYSPKREAFLGDVKEIYRRKKVLAT